MKKNFDHCLDMLLQHEGGFVNHPKDPGGMTNLGVTRATYEQYIGRSVTEAEMRALTVADVAPIYKAEYWDKARCDDLPSGLDWAVFDWGVNSGMSRPVKALQRIVGVKPDGGIGPQTLRAIANFDSKSLIEKLYTMLVKISMKTWLRLKHLAGAGRVAMMKHLARQPRWLE
jgi:lysozyme family protein